ncbi:hypothetical protein [uncultured Shewanella sp.]|nr:hypothetical protein [uncultured Shewanella sp.]
MNQFGLSEGSIGVESSAAKGGGEYSQSYALPDFSGVYQGALAVEQ